MKRKGIARKTLNYSEHEKEMYHSIFGRTWEEVLFHFVDNWGQFDASFCLAPPLSEDAMNLFQRSLELSGSLLQVEELRESCATDFFKWLSNRVPQVWGRGEDIGRLAMLFVCREPWILDPKNSDFLQISHRFPFPIVFWFLPGSSWLPWLEQNRHLFGHRFEKIDFSSYLCEEPSFMI